MSKPDDTVITFTNFRELGGLICSDGMRIKTGKLFRSPALMPRTEADRRFIEGKKLEAIIDLRCLPETMERKDYVPQGCEYINAPVFPEKDMPHIIVTRSAKIKTVLLRGRHVDDVYNEKVGSYRIMPFAVHAYSRLFEKMDEGKTIIFHCTEGKDRTGIAAMMIEAAFGRTKEQIMQEYLRSSESRHAHRRSGLKYLGASEKLIDNIFYCENVHTELLESAFEAMLTDYETPKDFLEGEYRVTPQRIEAWKQYYLEPAN